MAGTVAHKDFENFLSFFQKTAALMILSDALGIEAHLVSSA